MRNWQRASCAAWVVLILASGAVCGSNGTPYRLDYPAEVMAHVEAGFQARLEAVRQEGIPKTISDLAMWYPEPPPGENAARVYEQCRVVPIGRV